MATKRPAPEDGNDENASASIHLAKRAHAHIDNEIEDLDVKIDAVKNTAPNKRIYDLAKRTSAMLFLVKSVQIRSNFAAHPHVFNMKDLVSDLEETARSKTVARMDKYESNLETLQTTVDATVIKVATAHTKRIAVTEEEKQEFSRIAALCEKYTAKIAVAHKAAKLARDELNPPCQCPRENIIAVAAKLIKKYTVLAETELPRAYEAAKRCVNVEKKAKIETQCRMIAKWLAKAARALDLDEKDEHDPLAKVSTLFAADAAVEFEKLWELVPFLG